MQILNEAKNSIQLIDVFEDKKKIQLVMEIMEDDLYSVAVR